MAKRQPQTLVRKRPGRKKKDRILKSLEKEDLSAERESDEKEGPERSPRK